MSRLFATSVMVIVAALWGFAFVPQRQAMSFLGPLTYTGARFFVGSLIVLAIFSKEISRELRRHPRRCLRGGLAMGVCLTIAISLQQWGLVWTTAGKAGFLTSAYVSIVPLVGLMLGQRPNRYEWIGVVLIIVGSYLLADLSLDALNVGDLLVCMCAVFWALHVQAVGAAGRDASPVTLAFVQFMLCGLVASAAGTWIEHPTPRALLDCWWPLLYGSAASVGLAYTLQVVVQRWAEPTQAAIVLSTESVFAVAFGWLVLDERITGREAMGCTIVIAATLVTQLGSGVFGFRKGSAPTDPRPTPVSAGTPAREK